MRRYDYGCCCKNYFKMVLVLEGTTGYPSDCPETLDPATALKYVQDKLEKKKGHKRIIHVFYPAN